MNSFLRFLPLLIGGAYLAVVIPLSRVFPPENPDELIVTVNGYNFLSSHSIRYSLNDDLYPQEIYRLRDLSNHIARPLFDGWAGLWTVLGKRSTRVARGCAIFLGLCCLLLLYGIGRKFGEPSLGLILMSLCAMNPVFLAASCVVNEHIQVFCFGLLLLYLILRWPLMKEWGLFGYGAFASLALLIHQNAVVLMLSALLWVFFCAPEKRKGSRVFLAGAGMLAGVLGDTFLVDMPRMILFQKAIYWNFARPPILEWPWHLGSWAVAAFKGMSAGSTYYFFSEAPLSAQWQYGQIAYWASLLFLVWGGRGPHPGAGRWSPVLLISFVLSFITMALLVRRQEVFYALTLFSFLIPWMGLKTANALRNQRWLAVAGQSFCLAGSLFFFFHFVWVYSRSYRPLGAVAAEISQFLPPGQLRVAAPNVLWPYYPVENFRDVGATVTARYYTEASLRNLLDRWKPDVLIVESSFRKAYRLNGPAPGQLSQLLGIPVKYLHTADTGNSYGELTIYQLLWPPREPNKASG
jgi:hypothetical protein